MTIAEINGKISSNGDNLTDQMEDLLTSNVFGACSYVRPESLLLPFLRQAKALDGRLLSDVLPQRVEHAYYRFWPSLTSALQGCSCEPDVLIALRDPTDQFHLVLVEAKYLSGKSSSALTAEELVTAIAPADQLAREYLALLSPAAGHAFSEEFLRTRVRTVSLVYVTAHRTMPGDALKESMPEILRFLGEGVPVNLFWGSWFGLHPILSNPGDLLDHERLIFRDLHALVKRKRFVRFEGIRCLCHVEIVETGSIYRTSTVAKQSGYDFALQPQAPLWQSSIYSSARSTRQTYDWDVVAQGLPSSLYEGGSR